MPPASQYSAARINAAFARVETAKQNHPVGWGMLGEFGLEPDAMVKYAYTNGMAHSARLADEDDHVVVYAAAWLNGLAVGIALGRGDGSA